MTSHTPRPWSFRDFEPDGPLYDAVHSLSPCQGGGNIVCLSPIHGGYENSSDYWEANAHLIAAAPELLEALIDLEIGVDLPSDSPALAELRAKALAAIAKATGATP